MDNHEKKRILLLLAAVVVFGAVAGLVIRLFSAYAEKLAGEEKAASPVVISEIMASNDSFPADDGAFYDWVELYNTSARTAELSGWGLSDRDDDVKYVFPEGTLLPGHGYLTVWCSKTTDRDDMAPFGLSAGGGESVCLFDADGVLTEQVAIPAMSAGTSWQRGTDGTWALTAQPTPGEKNVFSENLVQPRTDCTVVISELRSAGRIGLRDEDGEYSDWAELHNAGDEPWDLTGWFLSDNPEKAAKWEIPALTLAPGEYRVVFCSGKDRREGELHTGFALSKSGGGLYLFDPEGAPAGELEYTAMERDQVCRRTADGPEYTYDATPGYPNDPEGYEAYIAASDRHGDLVINEVVAYYNGKFTDGRKQSYDWLELKNTGGETISLKGYSLTNSAEEPQRCPLPDVKLKPGALYIVFCAKDVTLKDGTHVYAPFNISSGGERLFLYGPDGELSDSVFVRELPYAGSIGRLSGGTGFYLFETPTPGKDNTDGFRYKAPAVTVDVVPGIYNDVESLTVTLSGEGDIRYTLDGSVPTPKSNLYTGPLQLTSTAAIRAVAFPAGKVRSDVVSFSYIINENHTLPVVALSCDPKRFRTMTSTGGYNYFVDGYISLFNDEGTEFEHGCSIRLHGNTSRYFRVKKLLMVKFNKRFGGNLQYSVFGDENISEYSSLLLRGETTRFVYILRDSVASLLANRVCETALTLDNRYCILYVNGKYFGIYPIREDYSRQYVASHTGSSAESCNVVSGPVLYYNEKTADIYDLLNYIVNNNLSDPECYKAAAERLDMTAMADWMLIEGYLANRDVGGNIRYVYGDNTGGKWRPAFYDLDIAMTNPSPSFGSVIYGGDQINVVMQSLLRSAEFRELVAERLVVMLRKGLADNAALEILDECIETIQPEIARDCRRWNTKPADYEVGVRSFRKYFSDSRITEFIDLVSDTLKLSGEKKQELYGEFLDQIAARQQK